MLRLRLAVTVIALLVPSVSATAAVIGLNGGDSDPLAITNPAIHTLDEANCVFSVVPLPAGYRCTLFDGRQFDPTPGISSLDVRLFDAGGALIPFSFGFVGDPFGGLPIVAPSTVFTDPFTIDLSAVPGFPLACRTCVFYSSHDDGDLDPAFVSAVAVNGLINPGATPVPEPSTVMLMGIAAGAARITSRRARARGARSGNR